MRTVPEKTFTINSNTVIGLFSMLIGGIVLYMVTTGMGQVKATANDVKEVKTVLPFMQRAIDQTQADVKESHRELKGDIKEIQIEQKKVREELMDHRKP
jgi:hypothetical protein